MNPDTIIPRLNELEKNLTDVVKTERKRPTERQYRVAEIDLALSIVEIHPCAECGWPVLRPYCCTYCGTGRP